MSKFCVTLVKLELPDVVKVPEEYLEVIVESENAFRALESAKMLYPNYWTVHARKILDPT